MAGAGVVYIDVLGNFAPFALGVKTAAQAAERDLAKIGGGSSSALATVAKGAAVAGVGLGALGVQAVKASTSFNKAMSGVGAVANATGKDLDRLREAALQAGADTAFSASEAATAEAELARAGVEVADVLGGGLRGALDLAAAGQLGLGEAAEIAGKTLNVFNLQGSETGRVADVLAAAANKSAADVSELGQSLIQAGGVAEAAGLSLEDTVGTLALFADNALAGSDGGTALRTMLGRLTPQSKEAADAMEALGLTFFDAQGNFVGIEQTAQRLQVALSGLTDEQRNSALLQIFGQDAQRAANALYKEGADGVRDYTRAVTDQGAAQRTARAQLDNLAGDFDEFAGSVETVFIRLGDTVDGQLRSLVQTGTGALNGLGEAIEGFDPKGVTEFFSDVGDAAGGFADSLGQVVGPLGDIGVDVARIAGGALPVLGAGLVVVGEVAEIAGEALELVDAILGPLADHAAITGPALLALGAALKFDAIVTGLKSVSSAATSIGINIGLGLEKGIGAATRFGSTVAGAAIPVVGLGRDATVTGAQLGEMGAAATVATGPVSNVGATATVSATQLRALGAAAVVTGAEVAAFSNVPRAIGRGSFIDVPSWETGIGTVGRAGDSLDNLALTAGNGKRGLGNLGLTTQGLGIAMGEAAPIIGGVGLAVLALDHYASEAARSLDEAKFSADALAESVADNDFATQIDEILQASDLSSGDFASIFGKSIASNITGGLIGGDPAEEINKRVAEALEKGKAALQSLPAKLRPEFAKQLKAAFAVDGEVPDSISDAIDKWISQAAKIDEGKRKLGDLSEEEREAAAAARSLGTSLGALVGGLGDVANGAGIGAGAIKGLGDAARESLGDVTGLFDARSGLDDANDRVIDSRKKLSDILNGNTDGLVSARSSLKDAQEALTDALEADADRLTDALGKLADARDQLEEAREKGAAVASGGVEGEGSPRVDLSVARDIASAQRAVADAERDVVDAGQPSDSTLSARERVTEAQRNYNEELSKTGPKSREYRDAQREVEAAERDRVTAALAVGEAMSQVTTDDIPAAIGALQALRDQHLLTDEAVNQVIGSLLREAAAMQAIGGGSSVPPTGPKPPPLIGAGPTQPGQTRAPVSAGIGSAIGKAFANLAAPAERDLGAFIRQFPTDPAGRSKSFPIGDQNFVWSPEANNWVGGDKAKAFEKWKVRGYGTGGFVEGVGNRDTIRALLTPKEYVNEPGTVAREGVQRFDALNSGQASITTAGDIGRIEAALKEQNALLVQLMNGRPNVSGNTWHITTNSPEESFQASLRAAEALTYGTSR